MMMRNITIAYDDCILQVTAIGDEAHLMLHADGTLTFQQQLDALHAAWASFRETHALEYSPVFMRYFLSDAANQTAALDACISGNQVCAVSVVEQPPLDGSKVALWVYMMKNVEVTRAEGGLWKVIQGSYRHFWMGNSFCREGDSCQQMRSLLENYDDALSANGCRLADDCIRTWIYVQNVDVNYSGVVRGRKEVFDQAGLTKETHYIASTGIAGRNAYADSSVILDAYAVDGLDKCKVRHLYAPSHLNPTYEYGVTFERGTAVDYPDRRQVFISGTASIDNRGQIVHPGDVRKQTERLLENVAVLLEEADCCYDDVMSMIIYLRDISDYKEVRNIFETRFPEMPMVFLWAPVCRPGWLVEMECIALSMI